MLTLLTSPWLLFSAGRFRCFIDKSKGVSLDRPNSGLIFERSKGPVAEDPPESLQLLGRSDSTFPSVLTVTAFTDGVPSWIEPLFTGAGWARPMQLPTITGPWE